MWVTYFSLCHWFTLLTLCIFLSLSVFHPRVCFNCFYFNFKKYYLPQHSKKHFIQYFKKFSMWEEIVLTNYPPIKINDHYPIDNIIVKLSSYGQLFFNLRILHLTSSFSAHGILILFKEMNLYKEVE